MKAYLSFVERVFTCYSLFNFWTRTSSTKIVIATSHSVTTYFIFRYSQFQKEYSLDEVMASPKIFDFLTILQCW